MLSCDLTKAFSLLLSCRNQKKEKKEESSSVMNRQHAYEDDTALSFIHRDSHKSSSRSPEATSQATTTSSNSQRQQRHHHRHHHRSQSGHRHNYRHRTHKRRPSSSNSSSSSSPSATRQQQQYRSKSGNSNQSGNLLTYDADILETRTKGRNMSPFTHVIPAHYRNQQQQYHNINVGDSAYQPPSTEPSDYNAPHLRGGVAQDFVDLRHTRDIYNPPVPLTLAELRGRSHQQEPHGGGEGNDATNEGQSLGQSDTSAVLAIAIHDLVITPATTSHGSNHDEGAREEEQVAARSSARPYLFVRIGACEGRTLAVAAKRDDDEEDGVGKGAPWARARGGGTTVAQFEEQFDFPCDNADPDAPLIIEARDAAQADKIIGVALLTGYSISNNPAGAIEVVVLRPPGEVFVDEDDDYIIMMAANNVGNSGSDVVSPAAPSHVVLRYSWCLGLAPAPAPMTSNSHHPPPPEKQRQQQQHHHQHQHTLLRKEVVSESNAKARTIAHVAMRLVSLTDLVSPFVPNVGIVHLDPSSMRWGLEFEDRKVLSGEEPTITCGNEDHHHHHYHGQQKIIAIDEELSWKDAIEIAYPPKQVELVVRDCCTAAGDEEDEREDIIGGAVLDFSELPCDGVAVIPLTKKYAHHLFPNGLMTTAQLVPSATATVEWTVTLAPDELADDDQGNPTADDIVNDAEPLLSVMISRGTDLIDSECNPLVSPVIAVATADLEAATVPGLMPDPDYEQEMRFAPFDPAEPLLELMLYEADNPAVIVSFGHLELTKSSGTCVVYMYPTQTISNNSNINSNSKNQSNHVVSGSSSSSPLPSVSKMILGQVLVSWVMINAPLGNMSSKDDQSMKRTREEEEEEERSRLEESLSRQRHESPVNDAVGEELVKNEEENPWNDGDGTDEQQEAKCGGMSKEDAVSLIQAAQRRNAAMVVAANATTVKREPKGQHRNDEEGGAEVAPAQEEEEEQPCEGPQDQSQVEEQQGADQPAKRLTPRETADEEKVSMNEDQPQEKMEAHEEEKQQASQKEESTSPPQQQETVELDEQQHEQPGEQQHEEVKDRNVEAIDENTETAQTKEQQQQEEEQEEEETEIKIEQVVEKDEEPEPKHDDLPDQQIDDDQQRQEIEQQREIQKSHAVTLIQAAQRRNAAVTEQRRLEDGIEKRKQEEKRRRREARLAVQEHTFKIRQQSPPRGIQEQEQESAATTPTTPGSIATQTMPTTTAAANGTGGITCTFLVERCDHGEQADDASIRAATSPPRTSVIIAAARRSRSSTSTATTSTSGGGGGYYHNFVENPPWRPIGYTPPARTSFDNSQRSATIAAEELAALQKRFGKQLNNDGSGNGKKKSLVVKRQLAVKVQQRQHDRTGKPS